MKPEPLFEAIEEISSEKTKVIYMAPDGESLSPSIAKELALEKHLLLVSGHYEGIDQRVRDQMVDREISVGDYVLTNGSLAASVLVDSVARHVPGVLGDGDSLIDESFEGQMLSYPQYTRPNEYRGMSVPEVLLSGNHSQIEHWRNDQRKIKTRKLRPDLLN
jgi:tRNA (guanine37-N1)-methyltransferase